MNTATEIANHLANQWSGAMWSIVWQSAVLAGVVFIVTLCLRRASAAIRFWLWMLVPLRLLVMPLITISLPLLPAVTPPEFVSTEIEPASAKTAFTEPAEIRAFEPPGMAGEFEPIMTLLEKQRVVDTRILPSIWTLLMGTWLVGVAFWSARLIWGWHRIRHITGGAAEVNEGQVLLLAQKARAIVGLKSTPGILVTPESVSPFLFGVLRPVLVIPAGLISDVSEGTVVAVFAHEFAHLRRRDTIIGWLLAICEAIYFFHPVFHFVKRRILFERERACDNWVIAAKDSNRSIYANALINAANICRSFSAKLGPVGAVAESFADLKKRLIAIGSNLKPKTRLSKTALIVLVLLGIICVPGVILTAREEIPAKSELPESEKKVSCTGIVINAQGEQVAGARVRLYELLYGERETTYSLADEVITQADGAFVFRLTASSEKSRIRHGYIVATKQGLAIGWGNWGPIEKNHEVVIRLDEPAELTGIVIDENGKPITQAKVSIFELQRGNFGTVQPYLVEPIVTDMFTERTDSEGRFTFSNLPAEAAAEFLVTKEGRATIETISAASSEFQFKPGQKDIRIQMSVEAIIEGMVVEKGSDKPVAGVKMEVAKPNIYGNYRATSIEPVVSNQKGEFVINALVPGKYRLNVFSDSNKIADWVAGPVEVAVEVGKTKTDVRIEVSKGGILEVLITDTETKKPIEKVIVSVSDAQNLQIRRISDQNGIARIRLLSGQYTPIYISKEGYKRVLSRESFVIEAGQTEYIERSLTPVPKITGIVRNETGKPLGSAKIGITRHAREVPWSDVAPDGKFEISRPTLILPNPPGIERHQYLVVRDIERNLAKIVELDEDTKELDIKLEPAVVIKGRVVDPDYKGIAYARIWVRVRLSGENSGVSTVAEQFTDSEGNFEIKTMFARHGHVIFPSADGYGQQMVEVDPTQVVDGRIQLKPLVLSVANRSVSGLVVDAENKPIAGAYIIANQSETSIYDCTTRTDKDGRFIIDRICDGPVRINVIAPNNPKLRERTETEAGATEVKIVVSEIR